MENTTEIRFNAVRYCYREVCAVKDVTFSLPADTLTVLVGPNGGGKSTLIKLLTGLIKPDEGTIVRREGVEIGYVPQDCQFDTSFPLTVRELALQGTLPKEIRPFQRYTPRQKEKAKEALLRVGLEGYESRGIGQLSGGQLRRAIIARALASDANVIVLDEPDASLDVDAAKELYAMLASLKNEKTIILASHNIDSVLELADKAIYVNKTIAEYASAHALKDALKGGISL
jgi:zinc transport system ATP-binding protein